jgi:hypothetical protein
MRQYRVELLDPEEGDACLLGLFETRYAARCSLREELEQWQSLASDVQFPHSVAQQNRDRFTVRTPSGQAIVYRVITVS